MAARALRASRLRPAARRSLAGATACASRSTPDGSEALLYGLGRARPQADLREAALRPSAGIARRWPAEAVAEAPRVPESAAEIREVCAAALPGWGASARSARVEPLPGTSNRNFKVHRISPVAEGGSGIADTVLFRVYGAGLELLYDKDLEANIAKMLSGFGVAAQVYAQGPGWRIEQWWDDAAPLPNSRMKEPAILAQVASHLGRLHRMSVARANFPGRIRCRPPASLERIDAWGRACERAALETPHLRAEDGALDEMLAERAWLADFLREGGGGAAEAGLDVVFSHWDPQENNILLTPNGLKFIDFEYSGMDFQAFDIATYFVECGIDLCVEEYPFYKVNSSELPSEDEMRFFCAAYLSEYLGATVQPADPRVESLVRRSERFSLAVHLLWAMWSVVRASRAPAGSFDYLHYGRCRWALYQRSKRELQGRR